MVAFLSLVMTSNWSTHARFTSRKLDPSTDSAMMTPYSLHLLTGISVFSAKPLWSRLTTISTIKQRKTKWCMRHFSTTPNTEVSPVLQPWVFAISFHINDLHHHLKRLNCFIPDFLKFLKPVAGSIFGSGVAYLVYLLRKLINSR